MYTLLGKQVETNSIADKTERQTGTNCANRREIEPYGARPETAARKYPK